MSFTREKIRDFYLLATDVENIFINEYMLYEGRRRFDPDYDMAESFRRLREGKNIQEHDLFYCSMKGLNMGL